MFLSSLIGVFVFGWILYRLTVQLLNWFSIARKISKFPGRKGYPILGNTLEFLGNPEEIFNAVRENVREYFSIGTFRAWLFVFPTIWVHDPEDIEKLMGGVANNEKSILYNTMRPWLGNGLLTSSGQHWHSRRKMLTSTFHFSILQQFLNIFNRESRHMVEIIENHLNEETNILPIVSNFTLESICETSMGVRLSSMKDADEYRNSIHDMGYIVFDRITRSWKLAEYIFFFTRDYWRQKRIIDILHNFSNKVIEKRKLQSERYFENENTNTTIAKRKQVALLDMLLLAQKQGEDIDDNGIREEVDTFMFEGHDTTAVCISFTLLLLANNQKCQENIYEEILSVFGEDDRQPTNNDLQELKYMERCIKESLRLYPSVPLISRKVSEDIPTKNGYVIPKGCSAIICIYDMHRKPDLYPEPLKFDPDRFLQENCLDRHPYAYIPFSAGPRNCIGQKFAMMEVKCVLTEIFRRYVIQPVDKIEDISCSIDMVIRTKNPMRMKFIRR
ncbi:hypothetical protein WA026_018782 [Henosepilachna vigintioctopunctata]|uniref:Cytochrome P450 n=1 Tax=Henosepilachna vigintioctopunctata TaxID=420089 RepID=A0AAW1TQN9_9CUCU